MSKDSQHDSLGMGCPITRRDFMGSTLAAAGASLLPGVNSPAAAQGLTDSWTGPGGIGDYAAANGNTASVVNAAHRIRDGAHDGQSLRADDTGELYDLVIVGGGVAGIGAAYTAHKQFGGSKRCLVLENHAMFGGESRGNLVELDGHVLAAPQGANESGRYPTAKLQAIHRELGFPGIEFAEPTGLSQPLRIPDDHYDFIFKKRALASTGFYLGRERGWARDPWQQQLRSVPGSEADRRNLWAWFSDRCNHAPPGLAGGTNDARKVLVGDDPTEDTPLSRWLDTMSYGQFIRDVMKLDSKPIARFFDEYLAVTLGGTVDGVSAYGARTANLPGVSAAPWRDPPGDAEDISFSFPMGNAVYPRLMVRAMLPAAYPDKSFTTIAYGQTRLEELDRPQNATRIRLGATVVSVEHDGSPAQADTVSIIYDKGGKLHRVRARGVVMACGAWVSRRVVKGMPDDLLAGLHTFNHTPVLVANVAVRHWRFFDKLGIAAARWFEGFGYATNIRRPMRIDGKSEAFSPDQPTMLTFYVPILDPASDLPVRAQTVQGRQRLFAATFADFEQQIRLQMQELFGAHGFDAKRDIGAIILNRWGHAFVVPEPGFFFGHGGRPAARDLARKGFGRIAFGSAELQGQQVWFAAYEEGRRAVMQVA